MPLESIELEPMTVACMCVSARKFIPDWVLDRLAGEDYLDAAQYNKDLPYLHYHVTRDSGNSYDEAKDIAFLTEADCENFQEQLCYWEGNSSYKLGNEVKPCYQDWCEVFYDGGNETMSYYVDSRKGR